MDHRDLNKLLPDYALGLLDEKEARIVSGHLATCDNCAAELSGYQQTAALLALGAPPVHPPDELKDELMRKIQTKRPTLNGQSSRPWWQPFWLKFSPAWAMASLAIICVLTIGNILQLSTGQGLKGEKPIQEMIILKMKGTPKAPDADGTLVIGQNPVNGVLVASDLPLPGKDHQYQLWLIKNGKPSNGGVFSVTPNGYAVVEVFSPVSLLTFESFSITLEPLGGSPNPIGHQFMIALQ